MFLETIYMFQMVKTILPQGIVALHVMFEQECVSGPNDQQPILAKLKYVGWIEEILELNYGVLNTILFFLQLGESKLHKE
jgi:hypothetical protein